MKTAAQISGVLAGLLISTQGFANHDDRQYAYAEVLEVEPVVREIEIPVSERVCWNEKLERPVPHYHAEAPSVVGSIIGGVIGNQFGGGRGRDAATVAGVLLGGAVARDFQRKQHRKHHRQTEVVTERVCEYETSYRTEERVTAYNVAYEYQGEVYHTQMQNPPGDRIRVRVMVQPVEESPDTEY